MYSALDITGLVLGILGLTGTVMLVRYLLPKHRIASAERLYATAYSMYQCSVSEGLLLADDKTKLRERLRRVRGQLNDLKNDVMCLNVTWRQVISALLDIYRCLGAVDHTLQSICTQIASTSRQGRERLEKDGITYEPCMFPLAATVSDYLESFRTGDTSDMRQFFSSQHAPDIPQDADTISISPSNHNAPSSYPVRAPQHRDSLASTTTTLVEECSQDSLSDVTKDTSSVYCATDDVPIKKDATTNLVDRPSLSGLLTPSSPKGADPGLALSDYCMDLQSRVDLLQSVLTLPQTSESPPFQRSDLEQCKEDLFLVKGLLSKVSDIWNRRETGPMLPV